MTTIALPWPRPLIALNDSHGNKYAEAAGRKQVRTEAGWSIRAAGKPPVTDFPVKFTLHWRIPDRRIRDADRLAKTAKGVLDACVDAGLLPADDWRYVHESACRIHPAEPGQPAAMWLTITPLEAP